MPVRSFKSRKKQLPYELNNIQFEPLRKNPISLLDDSFLDDNLKPLLIGSINTPLEISKKELRINSDLFLSGNLLSHQIKTDNTYLDFITGAEVGQSNRFQFYGGNVQESQALQLIIAQVAGFFKFLGKDSWGFDLDGSGTFQEFVFSGESGGGVNLVVKDDVGSRCMLKVNSPGSVLDYFDISVSSNGVTDISTKDNDGNLAHLSITPEGDLKLDPASQNVIINTTDKLYFDGGTDTYIHEEFNGGAGDIFSIYVGGDKMLSLDESVDTGVTSLVGTLKIKEQADASADTAGYGQIWVHDDTPNNLMFTDDGDQDIYLTKNTAVWGGGLARTTGANGKWLGIPTAHQGGYISFGTTISAPDTSLNVTTTADDLCGVIWQSIHGIRVTNCRIWYAQGGSTNTRHSVCLMRYDIDASGTLSNGVEVAGVDDDGGSDDYTTLAFTDLTMTSDDTVTNAQVLIAMVYFKDAANSASSAKCILEYQDV